MSVQYDIDAVSPQADLFFTLRALLLATQGVKEVKKANITSYFIKEGGICYLRTKDGVLTVGLFQGRCLDAYHQLENQKAKYIRHLYYQASDAIDSSYFKQIIADSIVCILEKQEQKELLRAAKKRSNKAILS